MLATIFAPSFPDSQSFEPISGKCSIFIPPEDDRKPEDSGVFQGVYKWNTGLKWVKKPKYLLQFFTPLCDTSSTFYPAGNSLFKVNNRNTRIRCEICSKLTIKTLEQQLASFWCLFS